MKTNKAAATVSDGINHKLVRQEMVTDCGSSAIASVVSESDRHWNEGGRNEIAPGVVIARLNEEFPTGGWKFDCKTGAYVKTAGAGAVRSYGCLHQPGAITGESPPVVDGLANGKRRHNEIPVDVGMAVVPTTT